ncbi:MAG TPA: hemolysin III family protein [Gaiellaceae bacterium]|nr:hemolysin III family protein [Gaiellaceae bacterium]
MASRAADPAEEGSREDADRPRLRGVLHLIAFVVVVPLGVHLAASAHGAVARGAAIAFAASVAAMFGVSSLFHRIAWEPQVKRWLGRLDHAMIYALIAGTYAPVGLLVLHPGWRAPVLATVWGGALAAAVAKFAWSDAPVWVAPATGVALGWCCLAALPQVFAGIGMAGALLLLAGGVAYTAGAIVYVRRRPNPISRVFGYHEVFHALVIVGVACQYSTIAFFVLPRA